jgi:hypothetical protein
MTRKSQAQVTDEENPQRIADYHRGGDNSIKKVMLDIKARKAREGVSLSGVDDGDLDEIKEPDSGKQEIKEPPRKTPR